MIGFDVVCSDLEGGNGVDVCVRGEQKRVVAQARIAALRVRRDPNVAEEAGLAVLAGGRFHERFGARVRSLMVYRADDVNVLPCR